RHPRRDTEYQYLQTDDTAGTGKHDGHGGGRLMSEYVDLLIMNNDLVLDPARQPLLVDDRASIAQDIAHLIRESGLLITLV
ncbi:hypothetical protein ALQ60_04785, partial [Pseudomonas syringae pv. papulans]